MRRGHSITLWRHRDFLKLWAGQTISELGSRITREGLPLTAVLVLHATPAQMGLLAALGGISVMLFGLVAGVWVDRLRRRPILIGTDLGRAVLLCTVPLAAMWHTLGMAQLYAIAALAGILTVFFDVAYQSYLPSLVGREQLIEGNTRLVMSSTAAEIAGPGMTGILVQLITAPFAILLDAISFLFSAAMLLLIRTPEPLPVRHGHDDLWQETLGGLQFIRRHPLLRPLAARSITLFFSGGAMGALYVLYAIDTLGLNPAMLGITIAMGGVGGTLGSLLSSRAVRRFGLGPMLIASALLTSAGSLLMPLAHGSVPVAMAFLIGQQLVGDFGFAIYFINEMSLRQAAAPDNVLGRVNAGMQLMARGVTPIGALVGGLLGSWIGLRPTMTLACAGIALSAVWLIWSPIRRLRSLDGLPAL
jgi:predicted MFS family arabinose efflux permease